MSLRMTLSPTVPGGRAASYELAGRVGYVGRSLHGGREFSMKGVLDFPALFKKRSDIK